MGIVVIWLLFGIVTAVAASNKNRDVVGWFILGCLFGPFALVLVLIMKEPIPGLVQQIIDRQKEELVKVCPYCAEGIKPAAVVCKHCGRDLPPISS